MITLAALVFAPVAFASATREEALDNAAAYALHSWTATSANRTAECSDDYESDYGAGTYMGLPYDWGGYMTIDEFEDGLAAGDGAGSHSWHGILECTVGLDCSGYVSKVWEVGHYATSTLYETTSDIDWDDLERADAVNDSGSHVVLFTHLSEGGWPVFYEASGGADKVHFNGDGGWSYLNGYQPVRLDGIQDGATVGTAANPIDIDSFPFTDYRWTAGAASDVLDVYSCDDADESGPEMLYRFHADTTGWLEAVVSDDVDVDIDVHVLTAPAEDACLGRGDTRVSVAVPAGDVWLSLDSYVGGREYPGPFILTATFTPGADEDPDPDPDPQDTAVDAPDDAHGGDTRPPPRAEIRRATEEEPGACATGPGGVGLLAVALAALGARRRRRGARAGISARTASRARP